MDNGITYKFEVSFTAQPLGEPFDFKALAAIFGKHFTIKDEWDLRRNDNGVDYFFSTNSDAALRMLVGKDKKGTLLIPTDVPVARLSVIRNSPYWESGDVEVLKSDITASRSRSKRSVGDFSASIGSRTSSYHYQADWHNDLTEIFSLRQDPAQSFREALLGGTDVANALEQLWREVVTLSEKEPRYVTQAVKALSGKDALSKIADNAARKLLNLTINGNIPDLELFIEKVRDYYSNLVLERDSQLVLPFPGVVGEQGGIGEPGETLLVTLDQDF